MRAPEARELFPQNDRILERSRFASRRNSGTTRLAPGSQSEERGGDQRKHFERHRSHPALGGVEILTVESPAARRGFDNAASGEVAQRLQPGSVPDLHQFFGKAGKVLGWGQRWQVSSAIKLYAEIRRALLHAEMESVRLPHFAPKAKRAIYLFMSGGPPQMDLLDYKPGLAALFDKDIPDFVW